MKVVHLSYKDAQEGAAIAVDRICRSLVNADVDSSILVQKKVSDNAYSRAISQCDQDKLLSLLRVGMDLVINRTLIRDRMTYFTLPFVGTDLVEHEDLVAADIIHIHWINRGFLNLNSIEKILGLGKKVVITLHDSWAFTGGCHMPGSCSRYKTDCRQCPLQVRFGLPHYFLKRKCEVFSHPNLIVTAPSNWMAKKAKLSKVFGGKTVTTIPNCVDISIYKPLERSHCRRLFNLPVDRPIVLFNITRDPRKGIEFTRDVIAELSKRDSSLLFAGFGTSNTENTHFADLPVVALGRFSDNHTMSALYNACDVMIAPALEEPFGQTYIEAMACGIPCVAFNNSGPKDIIDHEINGFLASDTDKDLLVKGVYHCLSNREQCGVNAVDKVRESFSFESVSRMFIDFYTQLLARES